MCSTGIVLAACLAVALAGPTRLRSDHKCAAYCKDATKFDYTPGRTYIYDYETDVSTTMEDTTSEASRLHVTAKAYVTAVSPCDFTLQLRDVKLEDSDPNDETSRRLVDETAAFQIEVERFPLSFAFQDGTVEELCPVAQEPTWVLNFKRGILSSLQNTMADLSTEQHGYETDVAGNCETNYTVSNLGWSSVTIKKSKNLLGCHGRDHLISTLHSTPYDTSSKVQSLPLIKSTHECYQTISGKKIGRVTCEEKHLFRPFSSQTSGALTKVVQSLSFVSDQPAEDAGADFLSTRASLLFDHSDPEWEQTNRFQSVLDLLTELEQKTVDDVRPDVPALFSHLVSALNHLDYRSLNKIPSNLNHRNRKFFMDALPLVKTSGAMGLVRDLILQGQMTDLEMNMWMTSLAFIHEPELEMIEAVAPLLDVPRPRQQAVLGVSALVHHYCVEHQNCEDENLIKDIVHKFEATLGTSCRSQDEDTEKTIILALKAIGNIGRVIKSEKVLRRCYKDDNSMETRLATIEAFRRVPCGSVDLTPLLRTYETMKEDTEVRIAAYLAVMRCPSAEVVDRVRDRLSSESVNQVGSFVWTHLTNLQETSDPSKQSAKELLANDFLRNKFKTDVRKLSRNYEGSFFLDNINSGATAESNVIFSSRSYLPRSAMLNLTVDLFGEAINLLEVGGRVEGLENVIENFFGPSGYFPEDTISNILKSVRDRREVNQETINELTESFNAASQFPERPQASGYLKIFGNELYYSQMRGLQDLLSSTSFSNPWDLLMKLTSGDIDYTKSFQFINANYRLPTVAGFPIVLNVRGSATVTLRVGGKFDISDFWTNKKIDIDGHIKPSAAMEVDSTMFVEVHRSHAGMKMTTTLHTSTFLDGKLEVQHGGLVKAKLNMPKNKMEIFDVSSDLFILHRKNYRKQDSLVDYSVEHKLCSTILTSKPLGVELCGEIAYPKASFNSNAPLFPFTGPTTVKLYLEKTDTFSSYEFDWTMTRERRDSQAVYHATLNMDTPGSSVDRRITANIILDKPSRSGEISIRTPSTEMSLSGQYSFSASMKSVQMSYSVDRQERLSATAQVGMSRTDRNIRYDPLIALRTSAGELLRFGGNILLNDNNKYSTDLSLSGLTERPANLKGTMKVSSNTVNLETSLTSGAMDVSMNGVLRKTDSSLMSKFTVNYGTMQRRQEQMDLTTKFSWDTRGLLLRYKTFFDVKMTQFPQFNLEATWDHQNSPGHFENDVKVVFNGEVVEIEQLWSYQYLLGQRNINTNLRINLPNRDIDFLISMEHQNTQDTLNNKIRARTNRNNEMKFDLDLSRQSSPLNYQANLEVTLPYGEFKWRSELQERVPGEFNAEISGQWRDAWSMRMIGTYKDQSTDSRLQHNLDASIDIPRVPTIVVKGELYGTPARASALASVEVDQTKYSASFLYTSEDMYKIEAELNLNNLIYSGLISADRSNGGYRWNVDLRLHRRITMSAVLQPYGAEKKAEFEVFWNRGVNDDEAFRLIASHKTNRIRRGAELTITASYPGCALNLQLEESPNKMKISAEWCPEWRISVEANYQMDIPNKNLDVIFTSSHTDDIRINANRQHDGTAFSHKLTGRWGNQDINYEAWGTHTNNVAKRRLTSEFLVTSTIPLISEVKMTLSHEATERKFCADATLTVNGQVMSSTLSLENKSGLADANLDAAVTFTSPFSGLEDMALRSIFSFNNHALNTKTEVQLAADKKFSIDLKSNFDFYRSEVLDGTLKIETPYPEYRLSTITVKYSRNYQQLDFNLSANWRNKNFNVELSGYSNSEILRGNMKWTSTFTAPITISGLIEVKGQEVNAELDLEYQNRAYSLKSSGLIISGSDFTISTRVGVPDHVLFTKLIHKLDDNSLASSWEGNWDDKKVSVEVGGSLQVSRQNAYQMRVNCAITTPWDNWQNLRFKIDHNCRLNTYFTNIEMKKNGDTFTASDTLKVIDWLNWEDRVEIHNPFASTYKSLTFTEKQEFTQHYDQDGGNYYHLFNHILDGMADNNPFHIELTHSNRLFADGPFTVHYEVTLPNSEKSTTDIVYTIEEVEPQETEYRLVLVHEYLSGKKINMNFVTTSREGKYDLSFNWQSPFTHPISFTANYDKTRSIYTTSILGQWSGGKHIEFNASGRSDPTRGEALISLMTPFENFEHQSLSGHYEITTTSFTARLTSEWQRKKSEVKMFLENTSLPSIVARLELETHFESYEKIILSAEGKMGPEPSATLILEKNNEQIRLEICLKPTAGQKRKLAIVLLTPFDNFKNILLTATADVLGRGPDGNTLDIKYTNDNGQSIEVKINGLIRGERGAFTINVITTFTGIETINLGGDYSLGEENKNFKVWLERGDRSASLSGNGRYDRNRGEGQIHIANSLLDLDIKTELEVEYDFTQHTKTGRLTMEKDSQKIEFTVSAILSVTEGNVNILLKTPKFGYETISLTGQYDFNGATISAEINLKKNQQKKIRLHFTLNSSTPGKVQMSSKITTPFFSYEIMEMRGQYDFTSPRKVASLILIKSDNQIELNLDGLIQNGKGHVTLVCEAPYFFTESTRFMLNWDGTGNDKTASATFRNNGVDKTISAFLTNDEWSFSAQLNTPFIGYQTMSVSGAYDVSNSQMSARLTLEKETAKTEFNIQGSFAVMKSDFSIRTESPINGLEHFGIAMRYDFTQSKKLVYISLGKNEDRVEMDLYGLYEGRVAEGNIRFVTPFDDWQNIALSAKYDFNQPRKSAQLVYEMNGERSVFAGEGSVNANDVELRLQTPIEGYRDLAVFGSFENERSRRSVDVNIDKDGHRHRFYFKLTRSPTALNLDIQTPLEFVRNLEVSLNHNIYSSIREKQINIVTNRNGNRSQLDIAFTNDRGVGSLSVELNTPYPDMENVKWNGEFDFKSTRKSLTLSSTLNNQPRYTLRATGTRIPGQSIDFELDIRSPARNANIKGSGSRQPGRATIKLDIDLDGDKKEIEGTLTYTRSSANLVINTPITGWNRITGDLEFDFTNRYSPSFSLDLQRSNRRIHIELEGNYRPNSELKGSLEITTPYNGMEELKLSIDIERSDDEKIYSLKASRNERHWEITLKREKETESSDYLDYKAETTFTLTSPVDFIRNVEIKSDFDFRGRRKQWTIDYERNDKKGKIKFSSLVNRRTKTGEIKLDINTPLQILRKFEVSLEYDVKSDPRTLEVEIKINDRRAKLDLSGRRHQGTITYTSTREGFENLQFSWNFNENTPGVYDVDVKLDYGDGRVSQIVGNVNRPRPLVSSGSLGITSQLIGSRQLTWDYDMTNMDDIKGEMELTRPDGVYKGTMTMTNDGTLRKTNIVINTPREGLNTIKYENSLLRTYPRVEYHSIIETDADRRSVDFVFTRNGNDRKVELKIDSPILDRRVIDIKIDATKPVPDSENIFKVNVLYGGAELGTADFKYNYIPGGRKGSFDIEVNTAADQFENIKADGRFDVRYNARDISINYRRGNRRGVLKYKRSALTEVNGEIEFEIRTPFQVLRKVKVKESYDLTDGFVANFDLDIGNNRKTDIDIDWTPNNKKIEIKSNIRNSLEIYLTRNRMMGSWNDQKVEINIDNKSSASKIDIKVTIETPFEGFQDMSGELTYERSGQHELELKLRRNERVIELTGTLNPSRDRTSGKLEFTSPYAGLRKVDVDVNYDFTGATKTINIDTNVGGKRLKLSGTASYPSHGQGNIFIEISTPYKGYKEISLRADFDATSIGNYNVNIEFEVGKKKFVVNAVASKSGGRRTSDITITTPISGMRRVTYHAVVSQNSVTAEVEYGNGKKIVFDAEYIRGSTRRDLKVHLQTPFQGAEELELNAWTSRISGSSVGGLLHISWASDKMIHLTLDARRWAYNLDVSTPWTPSDIKLSGSIDWDRATKLYSVKNDIEYNGKTISGEITVKANRLDDMQLTLRLQTPYDRIPSLKLDVAYTNTEDSFITRIGLETPRIGNMEAGVELTDRDDIRRVGFKVSGMGKTMAVKAAIRTVPRNALVELEIETPFHILPSYKLSGNRQSVFY